MLAKRAAFSKKIVMIVVNASTFYCNTGIPHFIKLHFLKNYSSMILCFIHIEGCGNPALSDDG